MAQMSTESKPVHQSAQLLMQEVWLSRLWCNAATHVHFHTSHYRYAV